jgi:HAD superfamily phosphatase (TIGR01668 family)
MDLLSYLHFLSPHILLPDLEADSLNEINIKLLKDYGIEALLFDVDGSITSFHANKVNERVRKAYDTLKTNFQCYIISNSSDERRKKLEGYFGAPAVQTRIKKPNEAPYLEALLALGISPSKAAMIGDRYLTDIAGANNVGIYSIKVRCLDLMSEPLSISLVRGLENALVGSYRFFGYSNGKPHKAN